MIKISAVIITLDEEKKIGRCLDSLQDIADEVIVVDSYSTDRTKEICLAKGAVFIEHPFKDYVDQRRFALEKASHNYILAIDADEAVSETLKKEILKVKDHWQADGYYFNRLNNYCGQWIHHGGWYPDRKLRLVDRTKGIWGGENPHERFEINPGTITRHIKGDLLHYSYSAIAEHVNQANKFSSMGAQSAINKGRHSNVLKVIFYPLWRFVRDYFIKMGFLDGFYGLVVASINGHENFLKYAKMIELQQQKIEKQ
ncbi:MAG TPA: glycosyltransferase family 2 protein [Marinilabiliales bacterium]|nr:glycosyltransferase family 2 protein [Marinilabiliales bacterium]